MPETELTLTPDDTRAASILYWRHKTLRRRNLVLVLAMCLAGPALIGLVVDQTLLTLPLWLGGVAFMAGWFMLIYALTWLYARWWGTRMLTRHPHLRHSYTLSVSNDGVALRGAPGEWTYGWQDFTGLAESPRTMLLMLGPRLFLVLPKRVLPDRDQALIRAHMQR